MHRRSRLRGIDLAGVRHVTAEKARGAPDTVWVGEHAGSGRNPHFSQRAREMGHPGHVYRSLRPRIRNPNLTLLAKYARRAGFSCFRRGLISVIVVGLVRCRGGGMTFRDLLWWVVGFAVCMSSVAGWAQSSAHSPEKIIIDTDIGDDVDDAFALALAVKSPELQVLGVTTTFGDTEVRAKITDRFLGEVGRGDIPVLAGEGDGDEESDVAAEVWGRRTFRESVARRCGRVLAGADPEVSGGDYADCDWSADECGGGNR